MIGQLSVLLLTTAMFRPKGPARSADALSVLFYWRDTSMNPLTMGLLSGGASLLGSIFSSNTSAANTQAQIQAQEGMQVQSEQFNAGQAQISRDYNTQMSNTAYQRAAADMKSAGLNPMMMAGGSMNASTPSSPTASVGTPSVPVSQSKGALSGVGDAVSKAFDAAVTAKTIEQATTQIAKTKVDADLSAANIDLSRAHASEATQNIKNKAIEERLQELRIPAAQVTAKESEGVEQSLGDKIIKGVGVAKYGAGAVSDVAAPIVSTATRMGGLQLLKDAMKSNNSATSFRKGMDASDAIAARRKADPDSVPRADQYGW